MDPLSIVSLTARRPASAPRSRPWSARISLASAHAKHDPLAECVFANSRELNRTHLNMVKYPRPPQPLRPTAPLDMLQMPSPEGAVGPILIPVEATNISLAATPKPSLPLSITIIPRRRLQPTVPMTRTIPTESLEDSRDIDRATESGTPERMLTMNSSVLQEYQDLLKRNILEPAALQRPPQRPTQRNPPDPPQPPRKRLSSARRASKPQSKCDHSTSFRRYKFAKRELSESFPVQKRATVFDPFEIYNVSNGTIRVT